MKVAIKVNKFTDFLMNKKVLMPMGILTIFILQFIFKAHAADLLEAGNDDVKGTFGQDSTIITWIYIVEVLAAMWAFLIKKDMRVLLGIVVLMVFTTVAYSMIG